MNMVWRARRSLSIATRLFLSATLCSLLILLVAGIALSAVYRRISEQTFDERLDVYLRALVADIAAPGDDGRISDQLGEPQFELPLSGWYWQVTRLDSDPPQIRTSRSLFAERLPRLEDGGDPAGSDLARSGYAMGPDGRMLRMLQRVIDDGDSVYLVQVGAVTAEIDGHIWRFELSLTATFVLLALALAGVTALQVRYGLRPLRRLQYGVAAIRRGEGERIEGDFPDDLAPLAAELNLLIAWNREILERARTHVGNLAHALKTPLSVIVNEAARESTPLAGKIREQAQAMRDQVTYYLERARAATRVSLVGSATEVKPVIDGLLRTFEKIYDERAIEFEASAPEGLRVRAERQDLEEMLGNLIDNAGKWAHSRVSVAAAPETAGAGDEPARDFLVLTIDDDGDGLPIGSREAALARGRRLDESKPGSGLGLSIVADLASIHGGSLILDDSPDGGLRAKLHLPAG
jgi:signal transduction histidine kinase